MKYLLFVICIFFSINTYSQTIKKDPRPDSLKADNMDEYQANQVSKVDLLRALDKLGVRVFNCDVSPRFTKTYKLKVELEEFLDGKQLSTKNISPNENNLYFFWEKENGKDKQYANYISKINFISRETDSVCTLSVDIAQNTTGLKLKKHIERPFQYYNWRRYSQTNWKVNTKVPLLVYASSWHDKKFDIERFAER